MLARQGYQHSRHSSASSPTCRTRSQPRSSTVSHVEQTRYDAALHHASAMHGGLLHICTKYILVHALCPTYTEIFCPAVLVGLVSLITFVVTQSTQDCHWSMVDFPQTKSDNLSGVTHLSHEAISESTAHSRPRDFPRDSARRFGSSVGHAPVAGSAREPEQDSDVARSAAAPWPGPRISLPTRRLLVQISVPAESEFGRLEPYSYVDGRWQSRRA